MAVGSIQSAVRSQQSPGVSNQLSVDISQPPMIGNNYFGKNND